MVVAGLIEQDLRDAEATVGFRVIKRLHARHDRDGREHLVGPWKTVDDADELARAVFEISDHQLADRSFHAGANLRNGEGTVVRRPEHDKSSAGRTFAFLVPSALPTFRPPQDESTRDQTTHRMADQVDRCVLARSEE